MTLRWTGLLAGFAFVLAACTADAADTAATTTSVVFEPFPTTSTSTTLSPAEAAAVQHEADVELINQLWWDQSISWVDGFDVGVQFWVDNNYPDMGCSFDDYMASHFPDGPVEGFQIERIANTPTIRLDQGWTIPGGRLEGELARGRVYEMTVRTIRSAPSGPAEPPRNHRLHVTVLDEQAHFFIGCSTG